MKIQHAFVSTKGDGGDPSLVKPSDWNEDHEGIVFVRKPSDESVLNSTALQDDDHLQFAVAENEEWIFEFLLFVTGATAADIKLTVVGPAASTILFSVLGYIIGSTAGSEVTLQGYAGAGATVHASGIITGNIVAIHVKGAIDNGVNAGDFKLQWAQNSVDGATATVVKENSTLEALRAA
ncbi:hypothetical protein LCGC14_2157090 [marine sediment metagenome]|uniref:Uncharacterized protein n=1 Tax=marine sediment metagenome TaxID=412755 RepID=A0A0F9GQ37_9ZZZZ